MSTDVTSLAATPATGARSTYTAMKENTFSSLLHVPIVVESLDEGISLQRGLILANTYSNLVTHFDAISVSVME
ncbi:hypothetical protein N7447_008315 [Penicillium robsamsonii]|uniref:uncharacterized protein n=1 Tax=Penicillium robsamsonii TaxID=1792511 RepID=UPI00254863B5|nr:uncharacterized protein N7447_008315 [Penicillium robsamsonii]KAJ5816082.1 hypothetical protein N7447_008315 [Penicillium robsamsonii]